jgi:hypothetical protein
LLSVGAVSRGILTSIFGPRSAIADNFRSWTPPRSLASAFVAPMRDNRAMNATTDAPLAPVPAKAEPTIAFVSLG